MSRLTRAVMLLLLLMATCAPRHADAADAPANAPTRAVLQDRALLQTELQANIAHSQAQVAALQKRIDGTADPALREALQLHIEAAKRDGQLEFFRIQLRHAQAMGRNADATELQGILDRAALEKRAPLPVLPAEAPRALPRPKLTKAVNR